MATLDHQLPRVAPAAQSPISVEIDTKQATTEQIQVKNAVKDLEAKEHTPLGSPTKTKLA